jgi:hypothetical protein
MWRLQYHEHSHMDRRALFSLTIAFAVAGNTIRIRAGPVDCGLFHHVY